MFRVLSRPFPEGIIGVNHECLSCLVYEGEGGARMIVGALTEYCHDGTKMVDWHAVVAEELNDPPSLEYVRLMLRSIKATWLRGDQIRREEAWRRAHPPRRDFRADFGRLDFSRPGRGGHGFDDGPGGY